MKAVLQALSLDHITKALFVIGGFGVFVGFLAFGDIGIAAFIAAGSAIFSGLGFSKLSKQQSGKAKK